MQPLMPQLRPIASLVWVERRLYLLGLPFVVISIGTGLAYPQVVRLLIDEGVQGGRIDRLNQMALLLVAILLVEAVAIFVRRSRLAMRRGAAGVRIDFRSALYVDADRGPNWWTYFFTRADLALRSEPPTGEVHLTRRLAKYGREASAIS